jgi:hypothetical protein
MPGFYSSLEFFFCAPIWPLDMAPVIHGNPTLGFQASVEGIVVNDNTGAVIVEHLALSAANTLCVYDLTQMAKHK